MPHVSAANSADDLGSTDEIKVFKHEGGEEEKRSPDNHLSEEKSSLIDLTESEVMLEIFCCMHSYVLVGPPHVTLVNMCFRLVHVFFRHIIVLVYH